MGDARVAFEASVRHPELAPGDPAHDGPHATLVVVTRDGLHHMRRLFDGLADRTAYRSFDVVVVDNASTDGTREFLEAEDRFPVTMLANDENRSFSAANNQGIEIARGDITVLCNNDIEPAHQDWLTRLVQPLGEPHVAATGPLLVYPDRDLLPGEELRHPMLSVQSAGMGYEIDNRRVRARNLDVGTDPLRPAMRRTREVGGLTAACVAARTADLREIDGLDEDYFYGSEDWDLGLRLARRGRLLLVGRSVMYHYEYGTQNTFASEDRAAYRRRNHVIFNTRWGAEMRRRVLLEHLGDPGTAVGGLPASMVVDAPDDEMVRAVAQDLRALGFVDHDSDDHPPVLELTRVGREGPKRSKAALCVALTRWNLDAPPPDRADVVLAVDGRKPPVVDHVGEPVDVPLRLASDRRPAGVDAATVLGTLRRAVDRPRFTIRNCAPDPVRGAKWGDTHFASSLSTAFMRAGFDAKCHTRVEWEQPHAQPFDVVVHLRGLHAVDIDPVRTNVMWIISHGDDVSDEELDGNDLVLVASSVFADRLRERTSTPVHVFHQATDPVRFRPRWRDARRAAGEVVVVANARFPYRRAPRWLMQLGWDFELYGANWDRLPEKQFVTSEYVPNDELSDIYATAGVVVADQWDHMAAEGFVANRLFDVAASGGFVVSDEGCGVREVFGDLVPTYGSREELDELLTRYTVDVRERERLSAAAMRLVRAEHTFDARVKTLLDLLDIE